MEKCETRVRITTKAMRLLSLAATCLLAHGAWADYVQIDSVDATGAQYVTTDFRLSGSDIVEVKFRMSDDNITGNNFIFCNRKNYSSAKCYSLVVIKENATRSGEPTMQVHYGINSLQKANWDTTVMKSATYVVKVDGANGKWYVNDSEVADPTITGESYDSDGPLALFASYSAGASGSAAYASGNGFTNYAKIRFYYMKIWDSDGTTLKHHLVPAYDTTASGSAKYGVLDIAPGKDKFYANGSATALTWAWESVANSNLIWMPDSGSSELSVAGNWKGNIAGDLLFVTDAQTTLSDDWTAALGNGKMKLATDGINVSLDIGEDKALTLTNVFATRANDTQFTISGGSFIATNYFYVGYSYENGDRTFHGNTVTVSDSTFQMTKGDFRVGAQGSGAQENLFVAENGAKINIPSLYLGVGHSTNNTIEVKGSETELTVATSSYIGANGGPNGNKFLVLEGAKATLTNNRFIGDNGISNSVEVLSGGTLHLPANTVYMGKSTNWDSSYGRNSKFLVSGTGSKVTGGSAFLVANGTGNPEDAHEVRVADGGEMSVKSLWFAGPRNRLVISNGTVYVTTSDSFRSTNTIQNVVGGINTTVRFEGANPVFSVAGTPILGGSAIFEYAFSADGFASAPFQLNTAITLPSDFRIVVAQESVKEYLKANPEGGIVPLMTTGNSSRAITIEDSTALSANLPQGCSLVNESGVLYVKIKSSLGMVIFVR